MSRGDILNYHIGRLLKSVREEQNIHQTVLCAGICSLSTLSRIEAGSIEADEWLVSILFERLGISINKFGYVFSAEGLASFESREEILELVSEDDFEEAKEFVTAFYSENNFVESFKQQFAAYINLIMESAVPSSSLKEKVLEALSFTKPADELISQGICKGSLLGRIERALLVMYADILIEEDYEKGVVLYKTLLEQLENEVNDKEERVAQYPIIAAMLAEHMERNKDYSGFEAIRKGLELLCEQQKSFEMCTLLEYEAACYKSGFVKPESEERINDVDNAIEAFHQLEEEYGFDSSKRSRRFAGLVRKNLRGISLSEHMQKIRKSMSLMQGSISEGICSAKTISRIENNIGEPSLYVYKAIMNKLGQEEYRYYSLIKSDDIQIHKLHDELVDLISRFEYEKAEMLLGELESRVDLEDKWNRQLLEGRHLVLEEKLGRLDKETKLEKLKEVLALTIPKNVDIEEWPLKDMETTLLNNIANTMEALGDREGAIELLKKVKAVYDNSRVNVLQNIAKYLLTTYNLTGCLIRDEKYKEAEEIVDISLEMAYCTRRIINIVAFLYKKITCRENVMKAEGLANQVIANACLTMYKQALAIAKIINHEVFKELLVEQYKEEYNINLF